MIAVAGRAVGHCSHEAVMSGSAVRQWRLAVPTGCAVMQCCQVILSESVFMAVLSVVLCR